MENLSTVYKRVQRYASEADISGYDMRYREMEAILNCSPDTFTLMSLAFRFGFEKGCRKTKKAVKS